MAFKKDTKIKSNFTKITIGLASPEEILESTVMYDSGEKVEFDKQGNWKDFDCRTSQVPAALIPEQIKTHIRATFPGTTIIKLDRNRRGYEVKLNNGLEVEYNRTFQVIDIDD